MSNSRFFPFVWQGDYEGKAIFYSKAHPENILGCINIAYTVA